MNKLATAYFLSALLAIVSIATHTQAKSMAVCREFGIHDDDYEKFKREGDELFRSGEYDKAKNKYQSCLFVPAFQNDSYAKERIILAEKLKKIREDATKLLSAGKGEEAVGILEQILNENPKDPITKATITKIWQDNANRLFGEKKYEEAKAAYQKAIKYADEITKSSLSIAIQSSDDKIQAMQLAQQKPIQIESEEKLVKPEPEKEKPKVSPPPTQPQPGKIVVIKPNRRLVPKILTAVIGLGAGGYAYLLNSQYQTKLNDLNTVAQTTDPDGDNVILNQSAFNQWETSYKGVKDFQSNKTTMYACLGVAGAAAITEIILLVSKPKSKKQTGFNLHPSTQNVGLALRYSF
jgi:tetratricopeptide (TPR) repeat protein